MKSVDVLRAVDIDRMIQVAENFDRAWRGRYPEMISTAGTSWPRPETAERELKISLARLPMIGLGFALWWFRSDTDRDVFIRWLGRQRTPALSKRV